MTREQTMKERRGWWLLLCGAVLAVGFAAWGIWSRAQADTVLKRVTDDAAVQTVAVAIAEAAPPEEEVVLPGSVEAIVDTRIYARTSGYLKRWTDDIGAKVKAGDVLAEIESPEVDRQLRQAKAELLTARANDRVAQATAKRVHDLLPTQSVSAEQDDQASSDAAAKSAAVASNEANVERLEQLVGFEKVIAPYDGIVTARETDVGALINAGSGTGVELFRVADTRRLRIYVQVPQSYAPRIKPGVPVELQVPEYPGRAFAATLVRTASALDPTARTLLVELQIDNTKGELLPGGYTDVHFKLPVAGKGVRIPASALLFRAEGLRVASVSSKGQVALHEITLGRDFGANVEILTGVAAGESIILNPPASLVTGITVRVRDDTHAAKEGAKS